MGLFASHHTFNDKPEEDLYKENLPLYWNYSPTAAEMTEIAIKILSANSSKGFLLVVEEEGTDNFPNDNNAEGMIEAAKRADDAIGVALKFAKKDGNTLVLTAADSDAGGPAIIAYTPEDMPPGQPLLAQEEVIEDINGAPIDGVGFLEGKKEEVPFLTPCGLPFAISWASYGDEGGGTIVRAHGPHAEQVYGTMDNTDIYRIIKRALGLLDAELVGRAVIPADTFVDGPTSGQHIGSGPFWGRTPPFDNKQPIQGISAILAQKDGSFFALSDNGFGTKENSRDYLLAIYKIRPDFTKGTVEIEDMIRLRDPNRYINFPIQNEHTIERYLTGADFDIESFQRAPDGTFWIGDEFGPFLIQVDAQGVVLRPPIPLPGIQSPQSPFVKNQKEVNLPRSGGFEGMAISPDGTKLYVILEKASISSTDKRQRIIYEFDLKTAQYTGNKFYYRVEYPGNAIGEMIAIDEENFLVIERDSNQGKEARLKRLYKIDIKNIDENGYVDKKEVADLLNIADPNRISLSISKEGDIGLGEVFSFPFVTIEAVAIVSPDTLVLTNDNNYPFSTGRNPNQSDDTEIIKIRLKTPLTN